MEDFLDYWIKKYVLFSRDLKVRLLIWGIPIILYFLFSMNLSFWGLVVVMGCWYYVEDSVHCINRRESFYPLSRFFKLMEGDYTESFFIVAHAGYLIFLSILLGCIFVMSV